MNFDEFAEFKPKDFLKLSQKLYKMQNEFSENISALNRTIISRIYYSVFLYIRQWSKLYLGYISSPMRDHRQLPNFIAKYGPFSESENKEIADSLRILKKLRQQADYELEKPKFGKLKYKWADENIPEIFNLANEIFDSFKNIK